MSKIEYDPVKDKLARIVRKSRVLRRIFYFILDLVFLRSWHIRRIIRKKGAQLEKKRPLAAAGCRKRLWSVRQVYPVRVQQCDRAFGGCKRGLH